MKSARLIERKRLFTRVLPLVLIIGIFILGSIEVFAKAETTSFPTEIAKSVYGKAAKLPKLDTKSIVVYSPYTNTLVFDKNSNVKISPFSTTKVLTAYIVAEKLPLDKIVTVSKEAAAVGDSSMGLVEGEKVTVEQLLYGLLLPSGNDAAYALAEATSGSIPKFAQLMNETAESFGCKNSHFVNPNGLKDDGHYSTAHDMAIIFNKAISKPLIKKISGTLEYNLPSTNKQPARTLYNTCKIMANSENQVVAAKTGSWDYENSIVFETIYKGVPYVVSMMASNIDVRDKEAVELIKTIRSKAPSYKLCDAEQPIGNVKVYGGNITKVAVVSTKSLELKLPPNMPKELVPDLVSFKIVPDDGIKLPLKAGAKVADLSAYLGTGEEIFRADLVSEVPVKKGWFLSKIGISNRATVIGLVAMMVSILLARVLIKRRVRMKKVKIRRNAVLDRIRKDIEERK